MKSLLKYYNENDRNDKLNQKEYLKRFNNGIKTPFEMKIEDKNGEKYKLFFNHSPEHNNLIFNINKNFEMVEHIATKDHLIFNFLINENLKNEILSTNEIEGVHSSRQNIDEYLKGILPSDKRIDEYKLIINYQKIINNKLSITNIKEVSNIYRDLLEDFLKEDDKLKDDFLFRNDTVGVYKGNKQLHEGINFKFLDEEMNKLIKFMEEDNYLDDLIKIAIFHYYFGYLHPFFDGNGRMNRFMSVYYLNKKIGKYSLLLSQKIFQYKDQYYKIFEDTNNIHNRGDLNYFIISFLKYIEEMIKDFSEDIEKYQKKLNEIYKKLRKLKENKKNILFILIRSQILTYDSYIIKKEIIKYLGLSETTVRRILDEFESLKYVLKGKVGKEFTYKLNIENIYIKEILNYE